MIRRLESSDVAEIFLILRELYEAPAFPLGGSWNESLLMRELESGSGLGFFEGSELQAFVLFRRAGGISDISILGTRRGSQRKGFMRQLLKNLTESAKASGEKVWLEVHADNIAARKMYESLGFLISGERRAYYRNGASAVLYTYS